MSSAVPTSPDNGATSTSGPAAAPVSPAESEFFKRLEDKLHFRAGRVTSGPRSDRAPDWVKIAKDAIDAGIVLAPDTIRAEMDRRFAERAAEQAEPDMKAHPTLMHALDAAIKRCAVELTPDGELRDTNTNFTVETGKLVSKILVDIAHVTSKNMGHELAYGDPYWDVDAGGWRWRRLRGRELIAASLEQWIDSAKTSALVDLRTNLAHDGSAWRPLVDQVLDAAKVTNSSALPNYRDACAYAFAHWMWQVKRRLAGKRTAWELFLVVRGNAATGKQGDGKSTLIKDRLCAPFGRFVAEKGLEVFGDTREHRVWQDCLIINFDELAQNHNGQRGYIEPASLDALKATLTSNTITTRVLGQNDQHRFSRMASCIGSTNHDLTHHFADETGMRRFFAIEVGFIDREIVNSFDWCALWRSIDEELPVGYAGDGEGRAFVGAVQATYKPHSTIQEWMDGIAGEDYVPVPLDQPLDDSRIEWFAMREVYDLYDRFCGKANIKPKTLRNFAAEMESLPVHKKRDRGDRRPPKIAMKPPVHDPQEADEFAAQLRRRGVGQ